MSFLFINVNHDVGYESSESIPISTGYILAALKAGGFEGIILDDLRDRPLTLRNLEKWIRRIDPQVVGFTAYQSTMSRIRFLCRYIKSRHRKIHVVLGGPQILTMPSHALEALGDVDVFVRGEAEVVLPAMARKLQAGEPLESVKGITCKRDGQIIDTGPGPEPPQDLDDYPSPYLANLLDLSGKHTAILLSSRGCRHVCWFCITPHICQGKVRYHSIGRTVAEMELLAGEGIERFWFADPNFTENWERTEKLLEEKIKRGIATPFWFQTRADLVDAPLLKKLQQAGADTVAFGLESGSPGVLKATNKGIVLKQLIENIKVAHSLGMEAELFSIFGLPGETVEDARETMRFLRSLEIPIHSNSSSQQMQLYFGSMYERNPERFGIKPFPSFRPAYISVGDQYETQQMSRVEIRKVRNLWALANEQMKRDVYYKQRTFEILDFLLTNRADLSHEPAFHAYGALAASAIEEFSLLEGFLEGYTAALDGDGSDAEELISSLGFFEETKDPAGPADRVIFDSQSWIQGVPFAGISGKYWDVLLGRGLLLPSFEAGFIGAAAGTEIDFSFIFPDDYIEEELRGKEVAVHAKIHKIFRSLEVQTLDEVKEIRIANRYPFPDLDLLREQNEILYYLALRDAEPKILLKTPNHFLMLVLRLAKLGKQEEVRSLAGLLEGKPKPLNIFADTLVGAGKYSWALEYYEAISEAIPSSVLKRVRCLLNLEQPEEALKLLESIHEVADMEFQETLLECLKVAQPDSARIPSLEHRLLDLRVNAALSRDAISKGGQYSGKPLVHGTGGSDSGEL